MCIEEKMAIRPDPALLSTLRRIFGADLVVKAWATTWDIESKPEDIQRRLVQETFRDDGTDELQYDAQTILVEFSNGNKVLFQNSEWAFISKPELEIYEV